MTPTKAKTTLPTPAGDLRGTLTTPKITVMVVAAAAPISCIAGIIPLSFAIGSGASTPAAFVIAGVVLLLFSVGYAAMSRRMSSAGGFYQYIARGLGKPPAVAASFVAIVAYNAVALTCVAGIGYFGSVLLDSTFGWTVNWAVLSVVAVVLVGFLGYREIDIAARVLVFLLAAEVAMVVILDVAIVFEKGADAFPLSIFSPANVVNTGSLGLGLMFALLSFIGFESAALYGEETRDPRKTVPRATYLSVTAISVFYFLSSWIAVGAIGPDHVQAVASEQLVTTFFNLSDAYASSMLTTVLEFTYLTSLLASLLALHNASNRYLFVAGREGLLPRWIGTVHPAHGTPSRASLVQTTVNLIAVIVAVSGGLDPYLDVVTAMTGLGTLGVVLLQLAASAAIGAYFVRRGERLVGTLAATAAAFVSLSLLVVLIVKNFDTLTGVSSPLIDALPWVLVGIAFIGVIYGVWLEVNRPQVYAGIATDADNEEDQ
ncbi:APC family permease [Rhodococcus wratislaviensis]|uniref:Putative amino acid transporter n=1 Tax=Rhodococcus wratislaviensis NBRC 100605 TaxID=1219028 RepID=X0Q235_RHOWR|nr:APC family permease [Rhodococcus wratislaviensis]GAF44351.1 putative amino acid transporter [Rhodococcus wratislaviensis NBRC 100605]